MESSIKKYVKWFKNGKESRFSIEIKENILKLNIYDGELQLYNFLRYIIKYTNISKIKYHRVSPYEIIKKQIKSNNKNNATMAFTINFFKIKNLLILQKKENDIILLYGNNMYLRGNYEIFIPDLMELIVNRGYAIKERDEYIIIKNLNSSVYNDYIEYSNLDELYNDTKPPLNALNKESNAVYSVEREILLKTDSFVKTKAKIKDFHKSYEKLSKDMILKKIDEALDNNNIEEFMRLSQEFKEIY